MEERLLVPIDESEQSTRALEYALETFPDADVRVLHVLDPTDFAGYPDLQGGTTIGFSEIHAMREERGERLLEEARTMAEEYGTGVETDTRTGPVAETIVEYADEMDVDHVVMGSHGRTGVGRVLLGSVAETVVRRSPIPVTVV